MIILRPMTRGRIDELDELWQKYWSSHSLPGFKNRITDALAVDADSDKIIGYGQVHMFAEAMLFIDPTARKRDKLHAIRDLMSEAFRGTRAAGIDEIYAFIQDPHFSQFIQRRYGFLAIPNPGELLLRSD